MKIDEKEINIDNLNEDEKEQLNKLLSKAMTPKKDELWVPSEGISYYRITDNGIVEMSTACLYNLSYKFDIKIGNYFKTHDDAVAFIKKLEIHHKLKKFANDFNDKEIDWNNPNQQKYFIVYNFKPMIENDGKRYFVAVNYKYTSKLPFTVYFTSGDKARDAINLIGEDNIKKYYFEINDGE